ncbi:helicase SNF2 [Mycolicibacterium conceptionense]|uniref:SNF2-related protein n=1 Tax=Mycolicibacterium conceptionense TaxID=451644 RepID=UPI0007EC4453|nr:DEAD/DEAH box helicase [Mycolicibacterium conceptionense]OBK04676.1 helicase SNF2 [Mycolicibacterium conceptionense]OMB90345.1 helicase SNF2 [Mycolicibacterium conceptionense]OMC02076.1 helicase SNF2 [Mycolicibacterium conceptionense]
MSTVGTIRRQSHWWIISAEPQIMMRLKRVLPGVRIAKADSLAVTATEEMAQEIEWVLQRWSFDMSTSDRDELAAKAQAANERELLVDRIRGGTGFLTPGPGWLTPAHPLRDYQRLATDLIRTTGSTLIVDELGLGKTLMSLALLEDPAARPAVAVTLTGLPGQWLRELGKFYPQLTGVELKTTKADKELRRILKGGEDVAYDLIVMNYAKLASLGPVLAPYVNTVIFDEIQELRRTESLKYQGAEHLVSKGAMVCGLSATPVYNFGGEMYSVMNVVRPGCLGARDEFLREWSGAGFYRDSDSKVRIKNPAALRSHLTRRGLFLRRTRADVGIQLPAIESIEQLVPSDAGILNELSGNAIEMARLILSDDASNTAKWQTSAELDWKLRQATGVSKAPFVADFVRMLLSSQEKVLLLGWHRAVYDIWMERLDEFNPVMYTGTESANQKAEAFQAFTKGNARVLIMSLRSGAGLDGLQDVCSTLVFGELDWSPGVHRQAIGRLGRPGQTNGVLAYFCVSKDGSDPVILDTLNIKSMESDKLIEPDTHNGTATPVEQPQHIKRLAESILAAAKVSA